MTTINDNNSSCSSSPNLAWLLECSQLIRDFAESPLEEDKGEHEGNSSLAERVARNFPKAPVCAEKDPDWRLVAEVIHHWGVDSVPFWFYDRFTAGDDVMRAEVRDLVTANEAIPDRHRFWQSMLALMAPDNGPSRFWICFEAYGFSREPRLLQYGHHLRRLDVHWTRLNEEFDADRFRRCVVGPKSMVMLRVALEQWDSKQVMHYEMLLSELFAVDWEEAWDAVAEYANRHKGVWFSLVTRHQAPAHFPSAVRWMGGHFARMKVCDDHWISRSIGRMRCLGTLGGLDLAVDVPPEYNTFQILLRRLADSEPHQVASVASKLLEAFVLVRESEQRTKVQARIDANTFHLMMYSWALFTGMTAGLSDGYQMTFMTEALRWQIVDQLGENGLLRLPAVDSDLGARMFVQFIWDGGHNASTRECQECIRRVNFPDGLVVHTRSPDDYDALTVAEIWRQNGDDWKPLCGVRLRALVQQLVGCGWITNDVEDLRPIVERLVPRAYGGGRGTGVPSRTKGWYAIRMAVDEFMELLDGDSEIARRAKRPRKVADVCVAVDTMRMTGDPVD